MNCLCTVVANDTAVWAPSFNASPLIHWSIPLRVVALAGEAITEKFAALFKGQLGFPAAASKALRLSKKV